MHPVLERFRSAIEADGLAPADRDVWRAWVGFKRVARLMDELPDPGAGVAVELGPEEEGAVHLLFIRQVVQLEGEDWLEPAGGVVWEFVFPAEGRTEDDEWALWSFDFPTFEAFVDAVERQRSFRALLEQEPLGSDLYWEEA